MSTAPLSYWSGERRLNLTDSEYDILLSRFVSGIMDCNRGRCVVPVCILSQVRELSVPGRYPLMDDAKGVVVGVCHISKMGDRLWVHPNEDGEYVMYFDCKPDMVSVMGLEYDHATSTVASPLLDDKILIQA